MTITRALFVSSFGHDALRPKHASMYRFGLLLGTALLCGVGLRRMVEQLTIMPWPRPISLSLSIAVLLQWAVFLTLYSSAALQNNGTVVRLLSTLPLTQRRLYWLRMLPQLYLIGLMLLSVSWALVALAGKLGLPHFLTIAALFGGTLSGIGYFFSFHACRPVAHASILIVLSGIELVLSRRSNDLSVDPSWGLPILLCLLIISGVILCCRPPRHEPYNRKDSKAIAQGLSPRQWFIKKLIRSSISRTSSTYACMLSCVVVACFMYTDLHNPSVAFLIAGFIAASSAADMRAITPVARPAEITALKGTWFFMQNYYQSSILVTLSVGPLLFYALPAPPAIVVLGVSQIVFSTSVGIFAGSIFTPQPRDIASQFIATTTSIALLSIPTFASAFQAWPPVGLAALYLLGTAVLIIGVWYVEYNRNLFIWRNHV